MAIIVNTWKKNTVITKKRKVKKASGPSITKTNIKTVQIKAGLTRRQEEELKKITEELPRYEAMLKGNQRGYRRCRQ